MIELRWSAVGFCVALLESVAAAEKAVLDPLGQFGRCGEAVLDPHGEFGRCGSVLKTPAGGRRSDVARG